MSSINELQRRAQILAACRRSFAHVPKTMRETLADLAQTTSPEEQPDQYGTGTLLEDFETQIADVLGTESAVFMPSGTMAQQIALRLHAQQTRNDRVGLHPLSHLVISEEDAYQRLSGLRGTLLGEPQRLFTLADLEALKELPGTLLIELPERNLGGALRPWSELTQIVHWARERGIRTHMDGARLWECRPYYSPPDAPRSYADIAGLFDTVYVSFYKTLNGIAGAALAGPKSLIDAARVWQQRYGGRLAQLYPFVISARDGLRTYLQRVGAYCKRAGVIAAILSEFEEMIVTPHPPHTNMMHVYLRGDAARLDATMVEIAQETGLALFSRLTPSPVPGYSKFERSIGEGAFDLEDGEIRNLYARLLGR